MMLFADILKPTNKLLGVTFEFLLILSGSFLLALSAQCTIPLPFSPVPFSLQTLAVLLIGAFFGAKRGFATVLAYITEGCLGMPIFAGGMAGFAHLIGPRGGYLLGFLAAAFLVGFMIQKMEKKSLFKLFVSFLLGDLTILVLGGLWLSFYVGATHAFSLGIAPFLLAELSKVLFATILLCRLPLFK